MNAEVKPNIPKRVINMAAQTELRKKIMDAVRRAEVLPIKVRDIYKATGVEAGPDVWTKYSTAFQYLKRHGLLITEGKGTKTSYNLPSTHPTFTGQLSHNTKASLTPVAMVEVPRCTLKLLIKHILASGPVEGELQRAVMQCVEKIL